VYIATDRFLENGGEHALVFLAHGSCRGSGRFTTSVVESAARIGVRLRRQPPSGFA
jgi:hypothetical protein